MGESRRRVTHGPESWWGRDLQVAVIIPGNIADVATVPPGRNYDSHPMSVDSDNWSFLSLRSIRSRVRVLE